MDTTLISGIIKHYQRTTLKKVGDVENWLPRTLKVHIWLTEWNKNRSNGLVRPGTFWVRSYIAVPVQPHVFISYTGFALLFSSLWNVNNYLSVRFSWNLWTACVGVRFYLLGIWCRCHRLDITVDWSKKATMPSDSFDVALNMFDICCLERLFPLKYFAYCSNFDRHLLGDKITFPFTRHCFAGRMKGMTGRLAGRMFHTHPRPPISSF